MRMRPVAMSILVVPTVTGAKKACGSEMRKVPASTPAAMATKIHSVR